MLKPQLKAYTPSPSGVYNIIKRHSVNRLSPVMKENKRQIIKTKAGELGHIDTYYLSKCLIHTESKTRYLVMVMKVSNLPGWM